MFYSLFSHPNHPLIFAFLNGDEDTNDGNVGPDIDTCVNF